MKVFWQNEYLGEWTGTPTLKEMRKVKREIGMKNPIRFLAAATGIVEEVPVIDPATGVQKIEDGQPVFNIEASEDWDPDAMCMWLVLLYARSGKTVHYEDIEGSFEDLRIELDDDEKKQAEKTLGKDVAAAALITTPDDSTSTGTD